MTVVVPASPNDSRKTNDDVWIRSACELCLNFCGVMVHRVNGTVVKIEGDIENPRNRGFACAKGNSGMISMYSPTRIMKPLRRTNPVKGIGVDPKWQEISWDEALDIVAGKLKKIREDDPRKLYFTTFDMYDLEGGFFATWANAFGTQCKPFSAGFYCGNNVHSIHLITEGGFEADPDTSYTKYLILVGSQFGSMVNYSTMGGAAGIAEKRPGGVKVVALDPVGSYAAGRAEEWVPVRPGTDTAFLLGIANLLVNEYSIYDAAYLKNKTNAPYLIDSQTGRYERDQVSRKPLVWDSTSNESRVFDGDLKNPSLVGTYAVSGRDCKPAFQLLKDHLRKYDPSFVSQVTTIPADTIMRIAREFGEAACIGATVEIKGKTLPLRPACVAWYRGLSSHRHSFLAGLAAALLNTLIGAIDVPGGLLATQQAQIGSTKDGLMTTSLNETAAAYGAAYPPRKVIRPKTVDLYELLPVAVYSRPFFLMGVLEPEKYRAPYKLEMLIQTRANFVKTAVAPDVIEKVLNKIPFMVSISMELDETAEFADIVFPDIHYLERLCLPHSYPGWSSGEENWFWNGQRPVVEAQFTTPWGKMVNSGEIMLELAKRAGFLGEVYDAINFAWQLKPPYALDTASEYTVEEMYERRIKSLFGEDKGLGWYMDNALVVKEKSAEQMYPGAFADARKHVYFEFMIQAGQEVEKVTRDSGMTWWDVSDYQPLPDWKPCPAYNESDPQFDLFVVNYKVPQQPFSYGQNNMLLQPLTDSHRDDDIMINAETARRKGISDRDLIEIRTKAGKVARGRVRLSELVHPEVLGCQGHGGRFAKSAINSPKGINYNDLIAFDEDHIDYVSAAVDSCIKVSVKKIL